MNRIITNGAELKLSSEMRELDIRYQSLSEGGCGYIAKWIGEGFIERGIDVKYLVLDNCSEGIGTILRPEFEKYANVESLTDLSERMIEVSHVLPIINNRLYVDVKGAFTSFESTPWSHLTVLGHITHKTLEGWMTDKYYNWNPIFMHLNRSNMMWIEEDVKKLIKSLVI